MAQAVQQPPHIAPSQLALPEVTPANRLLEKRRQQFEADKALEAAKQLHGAKEMGFRQREDALKRRDLELQESLLRFTHFLQENDAKRAKANRRAADDARLRGEREAEIARLQAEVEACREQREGMQAALQRVVKYQQYLQGVVESGDTGFQEVGDILARHATLRAANADLWQQQAAAAAEAERVRGATAAYAKAKANELLGLNNRLAALKAAGEAAAGEAAAGEAAAERGRRAAADWQLELSRVVAAAANLYQRCLQRSRMAHDRGEACPLAQLQAVQHFVGDLRAALAARQAEGS